MKEENTLCRIFIFLYTMSHIIIFMIKNKLTRREISMFYQIRNCILDITLSIEHCLIIVKKH